MALNASTSSISINTDCPIHGTRTGEIDTLVAKWRKWASQMGPEDSESRTGYYSKQESVQMCADELEGLAGLLRARPQYNPDRGALREIALGFAAKHGMTEQDYARKYLEIDEPQWFGEQESGIAEANAETVLRARSHDGPFFQRDLARLFGLPDDASMDAIYQAAKSGRSPQPEQEQESLKKVLDVLRHGLQRDSPGYRLSSDDVEFVMEQLDRLCSASRPAAVPPKEQE